MRLLVCILGISLSSSFPLSALGQARGGGGGGGDSGPGWGQRYEARKNSRFDILSFLSNQKRTIADQNSRMAAGGGNRWFFPDMVLQGAQSAPSLTRDGAAIGNAKLTSGRAQFLFDNLFTRSDSKRSLNFDVGFEGFYEDLNTFVPVTGGTVTAWNYRASGGALLLRPMGRSSQDNGLLFKFGTMRVTSEGLLANAGVHESGNLYYGAEGRLYLLPIVGFHIDYLKTLESTDSSWAGNWSMSDLKYGVFFELYFLQLGAYMTTREWTLAPSSGAAKTTDAQSGTTFTATLFF